MTRRTLIAFGAASQVGRAKECRGPKTINVVTDMERLNQFVATFQPAYNGYVRALDKNVIDKKRWDAMVAAWKRLTE